MANQPWNKAERAAVAHELGLTAVAKDKDLSDDRVAIYLADLADTPAHIVIDGLKRARKRCQFFPSVAEILTPAMQTGVSQAWAATLDMVRSKGVARCRLEAPADIQETVRLMGGWGKIGNATTGQLGFLERDFRQRWDELEHAPFMIGRDDPQGRLE